MLKNLKNLTGVKELTKNAQTSINGGNQQKDCGLDCILHIDTCVCYEDVEWDPTGANR
jgi:hypothetical protein